VSPKFNLDHNDHSAAASSDLLSFGAAAGIYAHIADAVVEASAVKFPLGLDTGVYWLKFTLAQARWRG
jgi:hypothetical protein